MVKCRGMWYSLPLPLQYARSWWTTWPSTNSSGAVVTVQLSSASRCTWTKSEFVTVPSKRTGSKLIAPVPPGPHFASPSEKAKVRVSVAPTGIARAGVLPDAATSSLRTLRNEPVVREPSDVVLPSALMLA